MENDPPRTDADQSKWAAILGTIDSPIKFFALPVLAVIALIALMIPFLPEERRFDALVLAFVVLLLVVFLVGAITFFRPENLQRQVRDIKDFIESEGLDDVIAEAVKKRFPQLEQQREKE